MLYSNDSLRAIYACERARTGNYGMDEEDYYEDSDDYDCDEDEEYDEEDEEDY